MIDDISERFDLNLSRVENLTLIYDNSTEKTGGGRRKAHDSDILRAALVLLHASLEDFLRSILSWKLPESGKGDIDNIPLLGQSQKNAIKFNLGSLVEYRDKSVDQLIRESVETHIERWSSFNDVGQIKGAVTQCGLEADGFKYDEINEMVLRRHNIVHKADVDTHSPEHETHQVRPINVATVNLYVRKIRQFKEYVSQQLVPVEYCPRSSFKSYAEGVLYFLENDEASKSKFTSDQALSRGRSHVILRDLLTLGHALIDHDGKTMRSAIGSIDEADKLLRRFCKNHSVYREIQNSQTFRDGFSEKDFIKIAIKKCRLYDVAESSRAPAAKTLLRFFWGAGFIFPIGDLFKLLETPSTGPYSISSASVFASRQFNMFFGDSAPTTVVQALHGQMDAPIPRDEAENKYTRNSIYALLKLGLISVDGAPSIPNEYKKLPAEEIVRKVSIQNPVISFVCSILEAESGLSGVEIGERVAIKFNCNWVRKSQQRNGASLGRWVSWLNPTKNGGGQARLSKDVGSVVDALRKLRKEDFGTLALVNRYSRDRKALGRGRPPAVTDEILQAVIILKEQDKMSMTEITARIGGVSRAAIYRALRRHGYTT